MGTRKIVRREGTGRWDQMFVLEYLSGVSPVKRWVLSLKSEEDEIGRRGVEEIGSPLEKDVVLIEDTSHFQILVCG